MNDPFISSTMNSCNCNNTAFKHTLFHLSRIKLLLRPISQLCGVRTNNSMVRVTKGRVPSILQPTGETPHQHRLQPMVHRVENGHQTQSITGTPPPFHLLRMQNIQIQFSRLITIHMDYINFDNYIILITQPYSDNAFGISTSI